MRLSLILPLQTFILTIWHSLYHFLVFQFHLYCCTFPAFVSLPPTQFFTQLHTFLVTWSTLPSVKKIKKTPCIFWANLHFISTTYSYLLSKFLLLWSSISFPGIVKCLGPDGSLGKRYKPITPFFINIYLWKLRQEKLTWSIVGPPFTLLLWS